MTLVLGLLANMLLGLLGWRWLPDVLAIVLVFWIVYQPRRVGLVVAFILGLAMDVHESSLLGQNALSYVVLSAMALAMQRRLLWFPLREQALQIIPLFVVASLLEWVTRLVVNDMLPHWSQLIAPLIQAALWPLVGALLLVPQRRALNPDNIRPL
jgi:rod shape-determining protein MreD